MSDNQRKNELVVVQVKTTKNMNGPSELRFVYAVSIAKQQLRTTDKLNFAFTFPSVMTAMITINDHILPIVGNAHYYFVIDKNALKKSFGEYIQ